MTALFFLAWMVIFLIIQGFYAMLEMACVSFNKVRLHYYVSKNMKRALWLNYLLSHPAIFFGTTLIGVNAALQFGSECSRRLYESLGLNLGLAPITEILLVLICAELAPMFAGRRHAEQVAMYGAPIIFISSIIFRPFIWILDGLCRIIYRLTGKKSSEGLYLSREEIQNMFEGLEDVNTITTRIFSLKKKSAKELMQPLESVLKVPFSCTVEEMRQKIVKKYTPYIPIYQRQPNHITAIAYPRDLLRLQGSARLKDHARAPWFLTESTSILDILKQFRKNNQSVAVVLGASGGAVGILTLDEILDEIFNRKDSWMAYEEFAPRMHHVILDRTFQGDMLIADFNTQFHVHLDPRGTQTLEELVIATLGHAPAKGDSIRIDQFELTVEETSLLGVKLLYIRTVY